MVERRIGTEVDKLHAARFTQLGVLLVQGRDRTAEVAQQAFQAQQVLLIIITGELGQYLRQGGRIRLP
ncbi:hypothetical protein D3C75_1148770 [compost metagenome]